MGPFGVHACQLYRREWGGLERSAWSTAFIQGIRKLYSYRNNKLQDMNEFLKKEYEICIDLIKYYDQRQVSSLQISAGLSSAVATVLLALAHDVQVLTPPFLHLIALTAGVTAISLTAFLTMMVQTRLYFIFPARQANAIRSKELAEIEDQFTNNRMYLDSSFPAFKIASTQSAMFALVCLQIGVFTGLCIYALGTARTLVPHDFLTALISGSAIAVVLFVIACSYLNSKGTMTADLAIHSESS